LRIGLLWRTIDDIRIPRWPWDVWALSHECEANVGKVATKNTRKLWKVMADSADKEVNFKNWKVPVLKRYLQA